ncbi:MAG: 50S ribosomal protein L23 [Nitrospirae bacterium]|nr:50S ribosomal protein L23 [Nitrospirota bacterium]
MNLDIHDVLRFPLITERSTDLRENMNKVIFIVNRFANKHQVKRAVEETLNVKVAKVNIINVAGKLKKLGRFEGKKPDRKKAIVTLKQGEKIKIFEG